MLDQDCAGTEVKYPWLVTQLWVAYPLKEGISLFNARLERVCPEFLTDLVPAPTII